MRRSEDLESTLLQYTRDKIALLDDAGTFRYVNDASREILGHDPEELVGTNSFEYIHPDERERAVKVFGDVIASDEIRTETYRYRFQAADDSWVWLESRFSNVTDESLSGYVISSRDISDQVEAERSQTVAEGRLRKISETIGDTVWMFSADWSEVLFVNPAYEETYGQSVEELYDDPTSFLDAVHPEDVPKVKSAMESLSAGESVNLEHRVDPENNYETFVWVQGEPVIEDGEVTHIVGFTRDITDRHRRERQLLVMDNLLRHNLRNDLTSIFGQAKLIARNGDEISAERARTIRRKGEELLESAEKQRTIIDLLTASPQSMSIDVDTLVSDAVEIVEDANPDVSVCVELMTETTVSALREVKAALVELVENAVEHDASGDPTIEISVTDDSPVRVRIQDSCPPIPETEFRVLTGEREMDSMYHSSGMGLWLAYWAVDLSDGRIEFERSESGNLITILLPRAGDD